MCCRPRTLFAAAVLALMAFAVGCSPHRDPVRPAGTPVDAGPRGDLSTSPAGTVLADNLSPTVQIVSPAPNHFFSPYVPPRIRIHWEGHDPDGAAPERLAAYKFKLIPEDSPEYLWSLVDPDSLRRRYAPAFAGWDSVPGDSLAHTFDGLTLNQGYLFVLVGFDEEGAYSEVFSLSTNMLRFRVAYPGTAGPLFTVWSDLFRHEFQCGGILDPSLELHFDVPTPELEVHWSALPLSGSRVEAYRWAVDIADPADPSPRRGPVDLRHWSAWDPAGTSATVTRRFPPPPSDARRLYIEASDSYGWITRVVINLDLTRGRRSAQVAAR